MDARLENRPGGGGGGGGSVRAGKDGTTLSSKMTTLQASHTFPNAKSDPKHKCTQLLTQFSTMALHGLSHGVSLQESNF